MTIIILLIIAALWFAIVYLLAPDDRGQAMPMRPAAVLGCGALPAAALALVAVAMALSRVSWWLVGAEVAVVAAVVVAVDWWIEHGGRW